VAIDRNRMIGRAVTPGVDFGLTLQSNEAARREHRTAEQLTRLQLEYRAAFTRSRIDRSLRPEIGNYESRLDRTGPIHLITSGS
jgi:hypothetical protein